MTFQTRIKILNSILLIVLLFALASLSAESQPAAGTWIEIHVNGPWDYLPDPSDSSRIVLIAPGTTGHMQPVYFSGPSADQAADPTRETPITADVHILTISQMGTASCPAYPAPTTATSVFNYQNVAQANIQSAIDGTVKDASGNVIPRYAIVLPKPNYTSGVALSDAAIDVHEIQDGEKQAKWYTTWMILHYCVGSSAGSVLYDGTKIDLQSVRSQPAMSFVMRGDSSIISENILCDVKSIHSVSQSAALLGLTGKLYGLFPEQTSDGMGQTSTWDTSGDCKTISDGGVVKKPHITSAGSGDCHKPPIAVNAALP